MRRPTLWRGTEGKFKVQDQFYFIIFNCLKKEHFIKSPLHSPNSLPLSSGLQTLGHLSSRALGELSQLLIFSFEMGRGRPKGISGWLVASEGNRCLGFLEVPSSLPTVSVPWRSQSLPRASSCHPLVRGRGWCTECFMGLQLSLLQGTRTWHK